jgi:hypothetical protein
MNHSNYVEDLFGNLEKLLIPGALDPFFMTSRVVLPSDEVDLSKLLRVCEEA